MYVIGKATKTDKTRLEVDKMSIREQKQYYHDTRSWLAYFVACWKLGELTDQECSRLKVKVLNGEIR